MDPETLEPLPVERLLQGLTPQRRFPNFDQLCRDRFLWRLRLKNIALDWKAQ